MKSYILRVTVDEEGTHIESEAEGLTGFEILGFLNWKADDIIKQLNDEFKPDIVERKLYVEDKDDI